MKRSTKEKNGKTPSQQNAGTELYALDGAEFQEVKAELPEGQEELPVLTYDQEKKQLLTHLDIYRRQDISSPIEGTPKFFSTLLLIQEEVENKAFEKEVVAFIHALNVSFDKLLCWNDVTQALRDQFYLRNIQATEDFVKAYLHKIGNHDPVIIAASYAPGLMSLAGGAALTGAGIVVPPVLLLSLPMLIAGGAMTLMMTGLSTGVAIKNNEHFMTTLSRYVKSLIESAKELGFLPENKDWCRLADKFPGLENTSESLVSLEERTNRLRCAEEEDGVQQDGRNLFVEDLHRYTTSGFFKKSIIKVEQKEQIELKENLNHFSLLAVGKNSSNR